MAEINIEGVGPVKIPDGLSEEEVQNLIPKIARSEELRKAKEELKRPPNETFQQVQEEIEKNRTNPYHELTDNDYRIMFNHYRNQPLLERASEFEMGVKEGMYDLATGMVRGLKKLPETPLDTTLASMSSGVVGNIQEMGPIVRNFGSGLASLVSTDEEADFERFKARHKRRREQELFSSDPAGASIMSVATILASLGFNDVANDLIDNAVPVDEDIALLMEPLDPQNVLPAGAGLKAAQNIGGVGRKVIAPAAERVGRAAQVPANKMVATAERVADASSALLKQMGINDSAKAAQVTSYLTLLATGFVSNDIIRGLAQVTGASKVAGKVLEDIGKGQRVVGAQVMSAAEAAARVTDSPVAAAGYRIFNRIPGRDFPARFVAGAAAGGASDLVLMGIALDDWGEIGQEVGEGALFGAGGATAGFVNEKVNPVERARIANESAMRYVATKSEAEQDALMKWSGGDSKKLLNAAALEVFLRGAMADSGSDANITYLRQDEYAKIVGDERANTGGVSRMVSGKPQIYINADVAGEGTPVHEMTHALIDLEDADGDVIGLGARLRRELIGDFDENGRPTGGLYTPEELVQLEVEYNKRLGRTGADLTTQQTTVDRWNDIFHEVAAEHVKSILTGKRLNKKQRLGFGTVKDIVNERLNFMARGLQAMGIEMSPDGTVLDANGNPVTVDSDVFGKLKKSRAVDRVIIDYVNLRNKQVKRFVASQAEDKSVMLTPDDLIGSERKLEATKGTLFKVNPDGTIKRGLDGKPIAMTKSERDKAAKQINEALHETILNADDSELSYNDDESFSGKIDEETLDLVDLNPSIPDSIKKTLRSVVDSINDKTGKPFRLEYFAAIKRGKYSSRIPMSTPEVTFLSLRQAKAGNLFGVTFEHGHFYEKIRKTLARKNGIKKFDLFNGPEGFVEKTAQLFNNHMNGLPGATDLDPNPRVARQMAQEIFDFLGVKDEGGFESGREGSLVRARRIDRIASIKEVEGRALAFDYGMASRRYEQGRFVPPTVGAAPFRNAQGETLEEIRDAQQSPEAEDFRKISQDIARDLGLGTQRNIDAIGGWFDTDVNKNIVEPSRLIEIDDADPVLVKGFAALVGALAPGGIQQGIYLSTESPDGEHAEFRYTFGSKQELQDAVDKTNQFGLGAGYTIDEMNNVLILGALSEDDARKISTFEQNINYRGKERRATTIEFPSEEDYRGLLGELRDHLSGNNTLAASRINRQIDEAFKRLDQQAQDKADAEAAKLKQEQQLQLDNFTNDVQEWYDASVKSSADVDSQSKVKLEPDDELLQDALDDNPDSDVASVYADVLNKQLFRKNDGSEFTAPLVYENTDGSANFSIEDRTYEFDSLSDAISELETILDEDYSSVDQGDQSLSSINDYVDILNPSNRGVKGRSFRAAGGSIYVEIGDQKFSIRDHEVSPLREKEFGKVTGSRIVDFSNPDEMRDAAMWIKDKIFESSEDVETERFQPGVPGQIRGSDVEGKTVSESLQMIGNSDNRLAPIAKALDKAVNRSPMRNTVWTNKAGKLIMESKDERPGHYFSTNRPVSVQVKPKSPESTILHEVSHVYTSGRLAKRAVERGYRKKSGREYLDAIKRSADVDGDAFERLEYAYLKALDEVAPFMKGNTTITYESELVYGGSRLENLLEKGHVVTADSKQQIMSLAMDVARSMNAIGGSAKDVDIEIIGEGKYAVTIPKEYVQDWLNQDEFYDESAGDPAVVPFITKRRISQPMLGDQAVDADKADAQGGLYELANTHEFIAAVMSDENLQDALRQIEVPEARRNLWQVIVDAIAEMMNLKPGKEVSLLEFALDAVAEISAGKFTSGEVQAVPDQQKAQLQSKGVLKERFEPHTATESKAKENGFDVSTPLYHKTWSAFDEFLPGGADPSTESWVDDQGRTRTLVGPSGSVIFLSPDPQNTPAYHNKKSQGERVIKAYSKAKSPLVWDADTRDWANETYGEGFSEFPRLITEEAKNSLIEDGYDSIHIYDGDRDSGDGLPNEIVILSPEDLTISSDNVFAEIESERSGDRFEPGAVSAPQGAVNVLYNDSDVLPKPEKKVSNSKVAKQIQSTAENYWDGEIVTSSNIDQREGVEDEIVDIAVSEVYAALQADGKDAADWYTEDVREAIEIMGKIHPELVDDEAAKASGFPNSSAAKMAMFIAMAATSQNLSVKLNSRFAEEQFAAIAKTGKFDPSKEYGEKASSISGNLDLANRMIDKVGWQELETFIGKTFSVKELEAAAAKVSGKKVTIAGRKEDVVQGAAIFGPKIGQGFLQNLLGNYDPVTIDLWMRRTWGRWTGDVLGPGVTDERLARLIDALRDAKRLPESLKGMRTVTRYRKSGTAYKSVSDQVVFRIENDAEWGESIIQDSIKIAADWQALYRSLQIDTIDPESGKIKKVVSTTRENLDKLKSGQMTLEEIAKSNKRVIDKINKDYKSLSKESKKKKKVGEYRADRLRKLGYDAVINKDDVNDGKPEWAKAATVLANSVKPVDVPSDQDREVISRIVNKVRARLESDGMSTTNADIQAILWYPEKDLWAKLRGEDESNLKSSYNEEFRTIAESRGIQL